MNKEALSTFAQEYLRQFNLPEDLRVWVEPAKTDGLVGNIHVEFSQDARIVRYIFPIDGDEALKLAARKYLDEAVNIIQNFLETGKMRMSVLASPLTEESEVQPAG